MSNHSIGVISDTHGLMRAEALEALKGSKLILHAGDIGSADILSELKRIAPVVAVRGNTDRSPWAMGLPWRDVVEIEGKLVYLLHDLGDLDLDPAAAGFSAVVSGHSHQPVVETRENVLFMNPGSAGPKRFRCPVSVGHLIFSEDEVRGEILPLRI
jgi:putative phosphoesterase